MINNLAITLMEYEYLDHKQQQQPIVYWLIVIIVVAA